MDSCWYCNKFSGSVEREEILYHLNDCQCLKKSFQHGINCTSDNLI
jgi:hypothetical protein